MTAAATEFQLEDFFTGRSRAWGIFQDRFGNLRQQFVVEIEGTWDANRNKLTLTEDFTYADGTAEQRIWYVTKHSAGHYEGETPGIVGKAEIRAHGSAVNLRYRLQVPIGARNWTLSFDDWMFRQDETVVLNRVHVRKWGILIGSVTICFNRHTAASGSDPDIAHHNKAAPKARA